MLMGVSSWRMLLWMFERVFPWALKGMLGSPFRHGDERLAFFVDGGVEPWRAFLLRRAWSLGRKSWKRTESTDAHAGD